MGARTVKHLNERGKGREAELIIKGEILFKVMARRNRLLGLWAAERLGLSGDDADAYARQVVQADFEEPGDDDVVRKVLKDFADRGVDAQETEIRAEMARLLPLANEQIEQQG